MVGGVEKHRFFFISLRYSSCLRAFASDAAGKLDVLRHDGHTFGVDGSQVGILEEANEVCLGGFLKGQDSRSLESEISFVILGNLTDKTLERQLADEKLG